MSDPQFTALAEMPPCIHLIIMLGKLAVMKKQGTLKEKYHG